MISVVGINVLTFNIYSKIWIYSKRFWEFLHKLTKSMAPFYNYNLIYKRVFDTKIWTVKCSKFFPVHKKAKICHICYANLLKIDLAAHKIELKHVKPCSFMFYKASMWRAHSCDWALYPSRKTVLSLLLIQIWTNRRSRCIIPVQH